MALGRDGDGDETFEEGAGDDGTRAALQQGGDAGHIGAIGEELREARVLCVAPAFAGLRGPCLLIGARGRGAGGFARRDLWCRGALRGAAVVRSRGQARKRAAQKVDVGLIDLDLSCGGHEAGGDGRSAAHDGETAQLIAGFFLEYGSDVCHLVGHGGDPSGLAGAVIARETAPDACLDPFTGTVFVFRSRRSDRLKLLFWDGTGLVMAYKRLEDATFTWPTITDGMMALNHAQFEALFAGLDWRKVKALEVRPPAAAE